MHRAQFFLTLTGIPMAEVEAPLSPPAPQEEEVLTEGSGPVDAQPGTDGEHEATDVVEAPSEPEAADSVAEEDETKEDGALHEADRDLEVVDVADLEDEGEHEAGEPLGGVVLMES